jgi:DeoR family transcriptional regulator, ulaG and ulaABCDEF operon transcriptional repressor
MVRDRALRKPAKLHASEREAAIVKLLGERGFVSFQDLDREFSASAASLRRDLGRLQKKGALVRVHGGARLMSPTPPAALSGVPFHVNVSKHAAAKMAIGRAAAKLCEPGEAVIIDGGTTTLQLCSHIEGLQLQVLTNSLPIVEALIPQARTRVSMPSGALFREQNILLSPYDDDGMSGFHASKLFLGAAAVGRAGVMQIDTLLIQSERRFFKRAERVILMVDSSKFKAPAGHFLCSLEEIHTIVTDAGIGEAQAKWIERSGVTLLIA